MALITKGLDTFKAGLDAALDRTAFRAAGYALDIAQQLVPKKTHSLESTGRREPAQLDGSAVYKVEFGNAQGVAKYVDYQNYVEDDQPYLSIARREVDMAAIGREELRALADRSKM